MQARRLLLLFAACLPVLLSGCAQKTIRTEGREFYFSSGGTYHLSGFGEWRVTLDLDGHFAVKHNVRDEITDYGTFALSTEENATLWGLVEATGINQMRSSSRPGVPDEVQYTLALTEGGNTHEVQIWIGEAREIEELALLVAQIRRLIEAYTGQQPVLN